MTTPHVDGLLTEAVKVHVVNQPVPISQAPKFRDVISKTYLASTTSPENVLGRSQARLEHTVSVMGVVGTNNLIALCDNEADAQAALRFTQTGTMAGTVLQPGMVQRFHHNDEVWLVAIGTGTPPLVSISSEFCR